MQMQLALDRSIDFLKRAGCLGKDLIHATLPDLFHHQALGVGGPHHHWDGLEAQVGAQHLQKAGTIHVGHG